MYSSAIARVSQNTMGTPGHRTCSSASESAICDGRTNPSEKMAENRSSTTTAARGTAANSPMANASFPEVKDETRSCADFRSTTATSRSSTIRP